MGYRIAVNAVLWPAPAKLNLFLHITSRRPDGYHELQTAFQFLDVKNRLLQIEVCHFLTPWNVHFLSFLFVMLGCRNNKAIYVPKILIFGFKIFKII